MVRGGAAEPRGESESAYARLKVVGAVAAGAACAFVCWSVFVGAVLWRPTGFVSHTVLGRIYRSGTYVQGIEGYSRSRINSVGLRGPELTPKSPAEKRVLFLGDSLTEGLQVPLEYTFAMQACASAECSGSTVTGVNGGRSGASPADYIALAGWYRRQVSPDVTVVQLSDQDFNDDISNTARNFYVRRDGDAIKLVSNPDFESADPLVQRFPWLAGLRASPVISLATKNLRGVAAVRAAGNGTAAGTVDAEADESIADRRRIVEWVVASLTRDYPGLVIVYLPQVSLLDGVPAETPTESLLRAASAARGVPFVDMRSSVVTAYERDRVATYGFANSIMGSGHLNRAGHDLVSKRLVPVIESRLDR